MYTAKQEYEMRVAREQNEATEKEYVAAIEQAAALILAGKPGMNKILMARALRHVAVNVGIAANKEGCFE